MRPKASSRLSVLVVTAIALSGCGGGSTTDTASAKTVAISATDERCEVAETSLAPGTTTFQLTNRGKQATEVYLYGQRGDKFTKVISEVENIGPGITRAFSANLVAGQYELACKPGMKGDGVRVQIRVAGTTATSSP